MRRHIAGPTGAQPPRRRLAVTLPIHPSRRAGPILADGRHGVLERTAGREMLAVADPAFHLLVLQLLLHAALVRLLLLRVRLPVDAGPEDDVLPDRRRVEGRADRVAFFEPEFRPCFAFGHPWVDVFFDDGGADPARGLDLFAVVVEAVGYYGFRAVFVRGDGLWWEGGGIVEIFVVGPEFAAKSCVLAESLLRACCVTDEWEFTWLFWTY